MINLGIKNNIKTLTGAKIILETLKNQGVDTIFGYPGGIVLEIYDELFMQTDIKHILSGHEQACIHSAEGYARTSGKTGVVLVTSGPGATNLITGLANAYLDGFPLVVLTGQVTKNLIGKDAFQEVNIVDITHSCTKKNFQVTDVNELEKTLVEAFEIANSGKKGPVLVDLAKNIFSQTTEFKAVTMTTTTKNSNFYDYSSNSSNYCNNPINSTAANFYTKELLSKLKNAKKPVIIAGGGVKHSSAYAELTAFANRTKIPVVSTMLGLGSFDYKNPLYFGMIGIFGSPCANEILRQSDLVISLGARLNDRIITCFKNGELENKIVQIDINSHQFGKFYKPLMTINDDIKNVLNSLSCCNCDFSSWSKSLLNIQYQNDTETKMVKSGGKLSSLEVVEAVWNYTKNMNLPVATEVGQHQLWCAKGYKFSYPEQFITSGGLGAMGFGFPASIGASIAKNGGKVICFAGDGSLGMNLQEFGTCVNYNLPIKIMLMDNGYLGMVRQLQEKNCDGRYSETQIHNPDFVKLCSSYGIEAIRVETSEQIQPALEKCFSSPKPFLIDFVTEPMEVV